MSRRRAPTMPDLFGERAADRSRDEAVDVILVFVSQTPQAWLLRKTGSARPAQWLPKSLATRGAASDDDVWTMPHWVAAERGWL